MEMRKYRTAMILVIGVLVAIMLWQSFSQPSVSDLKGGFTEVAFYRNENNTGPVVRVYIVTVADPENAEMEAYGNYMLHTKFGNTKVYFFPEGSPTPTNVSGGDVNFSAEFNSSYIAKYEKNASGLVAFEKRN